MENPNFLEDQRIVALEELRKALSLEKIPNRIEGYDISNIAGKEATGSMVVLTNGEIDKSQYRKFKITFQKSVYREHYGSFVELYRYERFKKRQGSF